MKKTLALLFPQKRSLTNFLLVALCSQFIYGVLALKGVAMVQMTQMWGISNTEIGALFSVNAFVGTFSYFMFGWMHDRFSVRFMLTSGIGMVGIMTYLIVFSHAYWLLFALFAILGLLTEGYFWPAVVNSVRQSTDEHSQGKAYGVLECIRGIVELAQNAFAIWLFMFLGQNVAGLRGAMAVNGAIMIILAILVWIKYPNEIFLKSKEAGAKTKESLMGFWAAIRIPEVWLIGITGASIYAAYVAIPYFQLFLKDEYSMNIAYISIFALFNTSLTRLIIAPIAGVTSDHIFKGAANSMRIALATMIVILLAVYFLPREDSLIAVVMILLVLATMMIYFLRPLYFVPIGEMKIPIRLSGSTMAIASVIIYSPGTWGYVIYGYVIDTYKGNGAYEKIFFIMMGWAIIGIICATILKYRMKHKRHLLDARLKALDERVAKMNR